MNEEIYKIDTVDCSALMKASEKFEEFRKHLTTEQEKAGAIQAFHYTFELSWKTMKKIIENSGRDCYYQKDIFREAADAKLISSSTDWFEFTQMRNLTVHTYNENYAEKVIEIFDRFSVALNELLENLKKLAHDSNK